MRDVNGLTVPMRHPILPIQHTSFLSKTSTLRKHAILLEKNRGGIEVEGVPLLEELEVGVHLCFVSNRIHSR